MLYSKKRSKLKNIISIDIYSDTICPWCYIAKRKLQSAIEELPDYRFDILWHPYQLNPDMPLEGMNRKDYLNNKFGGKIQADKIYKEINEVGKNIGIYFQFEKIKKTPNTFASHKLLAIGHKYGKQNQIIESLFYSYFIEGKDIGNIDELLTIAQQNNVHSSATLQYLQSDIDKETILQEEDQARKIGIKAVPCFIINKDYVLFGAQEKENFFNIFYNLIHEV